LGKNTINLNIVKKEKDRASEGVSAMRMLYE
jgi:hypothetical protein